MNINGKQVMVNFERLQLYIGLKSYFLFSFAKISFVLLIFFFIFSSCSKINEISEYFARKKANKQKGVVQDWHKKIEDLERKIAECVSDSNRLGLFYRKLGEDHAKQRNYHQALKYFQKAIELGEGRAKVYHEIGAINATLARFEIKAGNDSKAKSLGNIAMVNYEKALIKDPRRFSTKFGKILLIYYIMGKKEHGLDKLVRLHLKYPKEERLLFALGRIHFEEKKYKRAIRFYQFLLKILPENSEKAKNVQLNIQQCLIRLKKIK